MRKEEFSVVDYLEHIQEAILKIETYTAGLSQESFLNSSLICDAVIRNIEIIGEASHNLRIVHSDFVGQYEQFGKTLKNAYEMRNAVIHGYIEVDYETVYRTVKISLPAFKKQIDDLYSKLLNN